MPLNFNLAHGVRQETPTQAFFKEKRLQENQNLLFQQQEEVLRANQVAEEQKRDVAEAKLKKQQVDIATGMTQSYIEEGDADKLQGALNIQTDFAHLPRMDAGKVIAKKAEYKVWRKNLDNLVKEHGTDELYFESIHDFAQYGANKFAGTTGVNKEQIEGARGTAERYASEGGGDKEFAPDIVQYRNPESNEIKDVDSRDEAAIAELSRQGFFPMGPRDKAFLGRAGTLGADALKEITDAEVKSKSTQFTFKAMDRLLDRFESGRLADWEKQAQRWAEALGIEVDTENLSAKEAFSSIANQLALQSRNMGPGQILAGQMSDKDVQFLKDMNPQLIISKGGNKLIIRMRGRIAERQVEIAKLAREFTKSRRGIFDPLAFGGYVEAKLGTSGAFGIPADAEYAGEHSQTGLPLYETPDGKLFAPEF